MLAGLATFSAFMGLEAAGAAAEPVETCQDRFRGSDQPVGAIDGTSFSSPSDLIAKLANMEGFDAVAISGGDFSGWDFSGAELPRACFWNSDLSGSNWTNAKANGIGFIDSDLSGAKLTGAQMPDIMIRNPRMANVDARRVDWSNGYIEGGWSGSLEKLKLDNANLSGLEIDCGITIDDGCPIDRSGVSAMGADFSGAILSSFNFYDWALDGAKFENAIVGPRQVSELGVVSVGTGIILRGGDRQLPLSAAQWSELRAAVGTAMSQAGNPSFSCLKAQTDVEKLICGPYAGDLRAADQQLSELYSNARAIGAATPQSQRDWLKKRNACAADQYPEDCVRKAYDDRIGQLLGALGDTGWLLPGRAALFATETLETTAEFRETPLYTRLEPLLFDASMAEVLIERATDGTYTIRGDAVAANAHTCSMDAQGLTLDRKTGWYSIRHRAEGGEKLLPLFRYHDGRITIWQDGRPEYDGPYGDLTDYVSCGARASFPPMRHMRVPDDVLQQYRQRMEDMRGQ